MREGRCVASCYDHGMCAEAGDFVDARDGVGEAVVDEGGCVEGVGDEGLFRGACVDPYYEGALGLGILDCQIG